MSCPDRLSVILESIVFSNYQPRPYAEWRTYDHSFAAFAETAGEWSARDREHAFRRMMRAFEFHPETLPEIHALARLVCEDVVAELHEKISTRR